MRGEARPGNVTVTLMTESVEEIIQCLEDDAETAQNATDAATAAVNKCNTDKDMAFLAPDDATTVNALKKVVNAARDTHSDCRGVENDEQETGEGALDDWKKTLTGDFGIGRDPTTCVAWEPDWFLSEGDMYIQNLMRRAKHAVETRDQAADTSGTCDGNQDDFEEKFCNYARKLRNTCSTYSNCRDMKAIAWSQIVATNTELADRHRKMYLAAGKSLCFLRLLIDPDTLTDTAIHACMDFTADISKVALHVTDYADVTECDTTPVEHVPGDSAWYADEYSSPPMSERPQNLNPMKACVL